jgi:hypothetical protein
VVEVDPNGAQQVLLAHRLIDEHVVGHGVYTFHP